VEQPLGMFFLIFHPPSFLCFLNISLLSTLKSTRNRYDLMQALLLALIFFLYKITLPCNLNTLQSRKVILDPGHQCSHGIKKSKIIFVCFKKLCQKILKVATDVSQ
jgi:hypothetical protein